MRIKLIVFDLDGTLVKYENSQWYGSWDAIGYAAGLKRAFDQLTAYYLPRLELYEEWVNANARLLKGISVKRIEKQIFPPPYSKGVKDILPKLRRRFRTVIISSGVDLIAERVKSDLGIEYCFSNRVLRRDGVFTGEAVCDVPLFKKLDILKEIIEKHDISLGEVCAVGDNENDIPVLRSVGLGIAFEPRAEEVRTASRFSITDFCQLPEILEGCQ
ncbi:MAG: HAD family phosphatase [candidate division WOR-3 bacterium]|nr:HAD family phosphatase [candidate division WOR-3 bacterium]